MKRRGEEAEEKEKEEKEGEDCACSHWPHTCLLSQGLRSDVFYSAGKWEWHFWCRRLGPDLGQRRSSLPEYDSCSADQDLSQWGQCGVRTLGTLGLGPRTIPACHLK